MNISYMIWVSGTNDKHIINIALRPISLIPAEITGEWDKYKQVKKSIEEFISKLKSLGYTVDDKLFQSISVIKIHL